MDKKNITKKISFTECNEYQSLLYENRPIIADAAHNEVDQKILHCPLAVSSYIVEGDDAIPKEFPHMVRINL